MDSTTTKPTGKPPERFTESNPRECAVCGTAFQPKADSHLCCSAKCARIKGGKTRTAMSRITRTCRHCGKAFVPKHVSRITYCSRECAYAHGQVFREARLEREATLRERRSLRVCGVCGKEFIGRPQAKFCSRECRRERARHRALEYWTTHNAARVVNPHIAKSCAHCGKTFTTNFMAGVRLYCSPKCNKAASRVRRSGRRREYAYRRRAKCWGVGAPVNPRAVYERDGWRCQLCGKKVLRTAKCPHPLSATLDHIIPLAHGGQHEPRNVQLAHFICNSRKSDKGGGQLRLLD